MTGAQAFVDSLLRARIKNRFLMKAHPQPVFMFLMMALMLTSCSQASCNGSDIKRSEPDKTLVNEEIETDTTWIRPENGEIKFQTK